MIQKKRGQDISAPFVYLGEGKWHKEILNYLPRRAPLKY